MNTVEFSGLCGLYGWKRKLVGRTGSQRIAIKHERGVEISTPRKQLLLANEAQVLALLKFSAGLEPMAGNGQDGGDE